MAVVTVAPETGSSAVSGGLANDSADGPWERVVIGVAERSAYNLRQSKLTVVSTAFFSRLKALGVDSVGEWLCHYVEAGRWAVVFG